MEASKLPLCELIMEVEKRMLHMQYTEATLGSYRRRWKDLLEYAEETGTRYFSSGFGERYLHEKCGVNVLSNDSAQGMPTWKVKEFKRIIYVLADFQNNGVIVRQRKSKQDMVPICFFEPSEHFFAQCRSRYNSESTVMQKRFAIKAFLWHIEQKGLTNISVVNADHISSFLRTTAGWSQRTVATTLGTLGQFFRFLYHEKYLDRDLSQTMPRPNHGRSGKLPSIWTSEQAEKILASVNRGNATGKRDYAILLLVTHLGLRDSDIQNLTFANICWKECCIRLIQTKTKRPLELPLSEGIGFAIIDYLKYGRPPQDKSQYVFVRHSAPFGKCGNYYHIMRRYLSASGISFQHEKSHGLHTLRHTLATRLLEQQIPLQTISEILGHASVSSTQVYLQVDLSGLRQCALNPEEVC